MSNENKQSYKQNYTDNVELSIFNCGRESCQPGHTWGPGVRDHYLIHLVVSGKGVYQVGGVSHTLQEGDLFLAKPNQLITYAADEADPWEYYWVGFNGACASKLVQQMPFSEARPVHHCKDLQTIREALYNIYLSRGPEPQCEALMTGYLYIAEIAVSVGFFDQFYFSRVFKKVKGMPPSKYVASQEKDPLPAAVPALFTAAEEL